jgi:hypothetical protein
VSIFTPKTCMRPRGPNLTELNHRFSRLLKTFGCKKSIYPYLETSGGQSSYLYLNIFYFSSPVVIEQRVLDTNAGKQQF